MASENINLSELLQGRNFKIPNTSISLAPTGNLYKGDVNDNPVSARPDMITRGLAANMALPNGYISVTRDRTYMPKYNNDSYATSVDLGAGNYSAGGYLVDGGVAKGVYGKYGNWSGSLGLDDKNAVNRAEIKYSRTF